MKILVLNGSPKGGKSDVMHITKAFLKGMNEEEQHDVHVINIICKHIEYCTGCFACMHNGGVCIHDDDMKEMLEELLESDLLILSFPLYCYGMPAPLKAFMDRTLPLSSMAMQKVGDRYEHVGDVSEQPHRDDCAGKPYVQRARGGGSDRAASGTCEAGGAAVRRRRNHRRGVT